VTTSSGATAPPPLRLAAVGCGRVFERFHLPVLRRSRDWSLVAAVDPVADRLRWIGRTVPGIEVAGTLRELEPTTVLDAVLISTPPDTHCALASEALRRGAHVLIEKPMVLRPTEAESLLALARDTGRQIWVGYNRRFRPAFAGLRARLRATAPERLHGVLYELRTSPAQWGALSGFHDLQERGDNLLDDIASHQLDLIPWIVDRPVEEVRARYERRDTDALVVGIDLRFAGGLEGRCRAGHGSDSAERLEVRLADRIIVATHGAMAATRWVPLPLMDRYCAARTAMGSVLRRLRGAQGYTMESFDRQLAAWADALRGGGAGAAADGAAGARCVELVEACRRSLSVGGDWVAVSAGEQTR
jgi:predicted dehydrogenase